MFELDQRCPKSCSFQLKIEQNTLTTSRYVFDITELDYCTLISYIESLFNICIL